MRLSETTSLCRECKTSVPAQIVREGDRIVMRKRCAEHGEQEALISSNADWYAETMKAAADLEPPPGPRKAVSQGCPFDCGPCESHEQRIHMPVVPITSSCNLDCPVCYTHNKNEGAYHMPEEELAAILVHLRRMAPEKRILNLTGGEPTLHPQFEKLLDRAHAEGIRRVTISTHGMTLLGNDRMLDALKRTEARVILSFDAFSDEGNRKMLGGNFTDGKWRVLDALQKWDIDTTLLPVLARGVNDHEVGRFVDLALTRDHIRSVEFHNMTFTGQSGAKFDRDARYTTYDVLADLEKQSEGRLAVRDFVPSPAAHPLCYSVTYLLKLPGGWTPFPRFMESGDLRAMLAGTLYLEPGVEMERRLGDVIARAWAEGGEANRDVLQALRDLFDRVFDRTKTEAERMRVAERATKAVYVHSHMDEETFDSDRIRQCCVGMPAADGSNIPSCAYNVLYRERDARFTPAPAAPLVALGKGRVAA